MLAAVCEKKNRLPVAFSMLGVGRNTQKKLWPRQIHRSAAAVCSCLLFEFKTVLEMNCQTSCFTGSNTKHLRNGQSFPAFFARSRYRRQLHPQQKMLTQFGNKHRFFSTADGYLVVRKSLAHLVRCSEPSRKWEPAEL